MKSTYLLSIHDILCLLDDETDDADEAEPMIVDNDGGKSQSDMGARGGFCGHADSVGIDPGGTAVATTS